MAVIVTTPAGKEEVLMKLNPVALLLTVLFAVPIGIVFATYVNIGNLDTALKALVLLYFSAPILPIFLLFPSMREMVPKEMFRILFAALMMVALIGLSQVLIWLGWTIFPRLAITDVVSSKLFYTSAAVHEENFLCLIQAIIYSWTRSTWKSIGIRTAIGILAHLILYGFTIGLLMVAASMLLLAAQYQLTKGDLATNELSHLVWNFMVA